MLGSDSLHVEHDFGAPPEAVFDAWLDPRVLRDWWGVGDGWSAGVIESDARPGGRYRFSMLSEATSTEPAREHTVSGRYVELARPSRLVFTWAWEADGPEGAVHDETLVRLELAPTGDGTHLTLTHERLPTERSREMHSVGWRASLHRLGAALTGD